MNYAQKITSGIYGRSRNDKKLMREYYAQRINFQEYLCRIYEQTIKDVKLIFRIIAQRRNIQELMWGYNEQSYIAITKYFLFHEIILQD